ncbi:MAG: bacillithiol biosynthesis cysteine-adding enzyme BshC [Bacteroidetes bacterium]|nr:bacillithiol biosynthesis cysteine-adding enzyme BshC [Bacteroidota bacterium]
MTIRTERHPYRETGKFTSLVLDYLDQRPEIGSLHHGLPSVDTILQAIERRRTFSIDRTLLVNALEEQYQQVSASSKIHEQIRSLSSDTTFTITTAHQCNLFLGPLYTIYKALHAIRLADALNERLPNQYFVPVFYLGSEDADLEELNHIHLLGEKLEWRTEQTGAVGRMRVDQHTIDLIDRQAHLLGSFPNGAEWIGIIRDSYTVGSSLATATFRLLHSLFAERGLVVLEPDRPKLKSVAIDFFWKELKESISFPAVLSVSDWLTKSGYSAQAQARPINLFYLTDGKRERIERVGEDWTVADKHMRWNETQLRQELNDHPERFSPNVILRGLYQEILLPNLVYIGGGGELAYWLQLKSVFDVFRVPFPLLELRASLQWVDARMDEKLSELAIKPVDVFASVDELLRMSMDTHATLDLSERMKNLSAEYDRIGNQAGSIDPTLRTHVNALRTQALKKIHALAAKMDRAERRKMSVVRHQIETLQRAAFPGQVLQERWDNVGYYYSLYGKDYLDRLYDHLDPFDRSFTWVIELD